MELKCRFIISLLVKCFLLRGITSITDPCSSNVDEDIVTNMCSNKTAVENEIDGSIRMDSVVLRIIEHQSDCVCNISVEFQMQPPTVFYLRKYDDLKISSPLNASCGLAIDVENITKFGTVEHLDPITCLDGYHNRIFIAPDHQIFRLTSRKTNNNFINGYCLEIYRKYNSTKTPLTFKIQCFDTIVVTSTTETDIPETTTMDTSTSRSLQTGTNLDSKEERHKWYIISGSSAGGCILFICVLVIVVCKCRRKNSKHNHRTKNDDNEDYDSHGLKDNVLYVSSNVQVTVIGNYNTGELETSQSTTYSQMGSETTYINSVVKKEENDEVFFEPKKLNPASKTKPSNSKTTLGTGEEINGVEYAAVNKTSKVPVDHAVTSNEYAVVIKTWKT